MNSRSDSRNVPGMNFRSTLSNHEISSASGLRAPYGNESMINTPLGRVQAAPPLPPRPAYNNYNAPYNSHGGYFNNYGMGDYSGYGGYGYGYRPGYSSYGYGYGPNRFYGASNPESRFIQLAEESSRPAFQSIQSILRSFSSITMMFESTFHAIYSSYMSVIGVADNFGKLRSTFGQIFSAFAIIRTLNWMYRKLLYSLGISKRNPITEATWVEALNKASGFDSGQEKRTNRPALSMMLFLSIIMGGPYLLFKLMNQIYPNATRETWEPTQNPGSLAVGMFDFHAVNEQELSFSANQKLMIAPDNFQPPNSQGWLLACNEHKKIGLVPNNYVGMIMQSEKTGKTYLEHNGQKYQSPIHNIEPGPSKPIDAESVVFDPHPSPSTPEKKSDIEVATQND